ncbi:MAG: putative ABC transporter permease [Clostridia bacterium]|nr:putative ABC transporter permease [Clostridia bacterium]
MKKAKKNLVIFSVGAVGYGMIEILWRGYTHITMLFAGGFSFLGLNFISTLKKLSRVKKSVLASIFITSVELIFGIIFNVILKKKIWDYSKLPFNFLGQICPRYSFFWAILSFMFLPLANGISRKLEK